MESNHVRDLMEAYSSIYTENEEVEQLDEDFQGAVKRTLDAGAKATDNFMKTPVGKVIRPFVSPVGKGQGTVTADQQKAKIIQKQSFDLFDIIKGHLLDEGFADTEEAALAIMTNMSEEWREQILDERTRGEMNMTDQQVRQRRDKRDGDTTPGGYKPYVRAGGDQRSEHEGNRGKKKVKGRVGASMRGPNDNVSNYHSSRGED